MSIFRGLDFRPGGSLGIDCHVFDHPGTILKTNPDQPIPEWQKIGGLPSAGQQALHHSVSCDDALVSLLTWFLPCENAVGLKLKPVQQ